MDTDVQGAIEHGRRLYQDIKRLEQESDKE